MPVRSTTLLKSTSSRKAVEAVVEEFYQNYEVRVGKRVVGRASAGNDCYGRFAIRKVAVRDDYRRRGVATALYRRIEDDAGKQLVPAVSVSDDAFEFWKRYRPEAVQNDLRHRRDELEGRKVLKGDRLATIVSVSARGVTARYDDMVPGSMNSEQMIPARQIDEMLVQTCTNPRDEVPGESKFEP